VHYKKDDLLNCWTSSSDISGYRVDSYEGHGTVGAWQGHGMLCVNQPTYQLSMHLAGNLGPLMGYLPHHIELCGPLMVYLPKCETLMSFCTCWHLCHVKLVDIMLTFDVVPVHQTAAKEDLTRPGFYTPQLCGQLHKQMGLPLTLSPVVGNFVVTDGGQSQHVHGPARELAVYSCYLYSLPFFFTYLSPRLPVAIPASSCTADQIVAAPQLHF
jgi:hypothetical protein